MPQQLFHIYGPLSIQSFGLAISIGFYLTLHLLLKHPKRKNLIKSDVLIHLLLVIICAAIIGGRALYIALNWNPKMTMYHLISFWDGGFSLLGSLITSGLCTFWFLQKHTIPVLPMFDLLAVHAPLMQSIARIGCFMAGCCYGYSTSIPWHTIYRNNTFAPTGIPLHPTQLYSAGILFIIFSLLYWYAQHHVQKTGYLFYLYLLSASTERFVIDYFRGDREFLPWKWTQLLSIHQWIACILMIIAGSLLLLSPTPTQSSVTPQKS